MPSYALWHIRLEPSFGRLCSGFGRCKRLSCLRRWKWRRRRRGRCGRRGENLVICEMLRGLCLEEPTSSQEGPC